jgi:hypothetical protein
MKSSGERPRPADPCRVRSTKKGGKYFLFGITTDITSTTSYVVLLAQQ